MKWEIKAQVKLSNLPKIIQLESAGAKVCTWGAWVPGLMLLKLPHQLEKGNSKYSSGT